MFVPNNEHLINEINAGILQTNITDHFTTCISLPTNISLPNKGKSVFLIDHDKMNEVHNRYNECYIEFQRIISNYIDKSTTFKKLIKKNLCQK